MLVSFTMFHCSVMYEAALYHHIHKTYIFHVFLIKGRNFFSFIFLYTYIEFTICSSESYQFNLERAKHLI